MGPLASMSCTSQSKLLARDPGHPVPKAGSQVCLLAAHKGKEGSRERPGTGGPGRQGNSGSRPDLCSWVRQAVGAQLENWGWGGRCWLSAPPRVPQQGWKPGDLGPYPKQSV